MQNIRAEVLLPTCDLSADLPFFTKRFGFRLMEIFPADDPRVALLSGYGLRLRLDQSLDAAPGVLRLLGDEPALLADGETNLTSPGGTHVEIAALHPPVHQPQTAHSLVVRRLADNAPWVVGRAGMHYRDLIPDRLGGSIIASHIRIPGGGPVPDMVHYHSVGFQLIFCIKGWVDLVYEDQGTPFRLHAGNCVIQPPEIRHRVLYASDDIEVIEIGVPAEHITTIDHEMELPTDRVAPERTFDGQRFVHFKADSTPWQAARLSGFETQDTGINVNTNQVAQVTVLRPDGDATNATAHDADILFTYVMAGRMQLRTDEAQHTLEAGDAFVLPPGHPAHYAAVSDDLRLLEVSLPGRFVTRVLSATSP
ncbi:cupin domain-containing protein [Pseudaestuariivita sp.]|uniref:cupin domain-containing protein n=1 Tax=Pseudaestuariivita sp. TaxID=2211669 RepID=UPI00405972FE